MHGCCYWIDFNECESGTPLCDENAFCVNTDGSFYCNCDIGYTGSGDIRNCSGIFTVIFLLTGKVIITCFADIDECVLGSDNCHDNATCMNSIGSYTCMCNDGFEGNGSHCISEFNCFPYDRKFINIYYRCE